MKLSELTAEEASAVLREEDVRAAPIFARLGYLFDGRVAEETIDWSYAKSFANGSSFRFADDGEGLLNLLRCELGPEIVIEDPELGGLFCGPRGPDDLTIPTDELCALLAGKSLDAFER